jgi:hypothetical protein
MAADCYGCVAKWHALTNNPLGAALNNPLGCCVNCNAFFCGQHAHLPSGAPKYICVTCDAHTLKASGIILVNDPSLPAELSKLRVSGLPRSVWVVSSIEDFQSTRPGYDETLFEAARSIVEHIDWTQTTVPESIWTSKEAGRLYTLAALIADKYKIPADEDVLSIQNQLFAWER